MEEALKTLFLLFLGYGLGTIPFGLIFCKVAGYGNIRQIGSGNIGATNVLRTGNRILALLTLICDSGKGAFLILISLYLSYNYYSHVDHIPTINSLARPHLILGLGAILGHCFPIWLKFKGGKGVATALGALLAAVPYAGLAACAAWLITAKITKISSLSALVAVAIAPIVTLIMYGLAPASICVFITLLVWVRHKDNIKRLLKGEEPKIGSGKRKED